MAKPSPVRKKSKERLLMVWCISTHRLTTPSSRFLTAREMYSPGPRLEDQDFAVRVKTRRLQHRLLRTGPAKKPKITGLRIST